QDLTPGLAEALGLGVGRGALVSEVEPGSPAEQAGVEVGDVVTAVNGAEVTTSTALRNAIGLVRLGETVTLAYVRDCRMMEVDVRVGPAEQTAAAPPPDADDPPQSLQGLDGAELVTLDPADPRSGGRSGVLVANVRPGSAAARNGLLPNDLISAVNRTDVATVAELNAALAQATGAVALRVERMERQLFLLIQ